MTKYSGMAKSASSDVVEARVDNLAIRRCGECGVPYVHKNTKTSSVTKECPTCGSEVTDV